MVVTIKAYFFQFKTSYVMTDGRASNLSMIYIRPKLQYELQVINIVQIYNQDSIIFHTQMIRRKTINAKKVGARNQEQSSHRCRSWLVFEHIG